MKTYKTELYWKKYQRFFPPRAQVSLDDSIHEEWHEWNGSSIHLDRFFHKDAPITIILVHGAGGYGRLFAPFGKILQTAGYEVVAPDLPGYGLTSGDKNCNYEAWSEFLAYFIEYEYLRRNRPVVLLGGSIGGYLSYLAAAKSNYVAGIIATTLADPRLSIVQKQFAKNWFILNFGLPSLPFWAKLIGGLKLPIKWFTKMDAMSNNRELSAIVENDMLGGGNLVSISFIHSLFNIKPTIEPKDFDRCPVLLVHPASDNWTNIESSRLFFDKIKGDKKLVILENCGHFPVEEPGITQLEQTVLDFLSTIENHDTKQKTN